MQTISITTQREYGPPASPEFVGTYLVGLDSSDFFFEPVITADSARVRIARGGVARYSGPALFIAVMDDFGDLVCVRRFS